MDRIEWLEMKDLITFQFLIVLHTPDHGQIDSVLVLRARSEGGVEDDSIGTNTIDTEWIAQRQLVLVKVPVLSEQSTSTPASSSIADNLVTIACFFASRRAPTAMATDSTVGMATGIAATSNTNANSNVLRIGS